MIRENSLHHAAQNNSKETAELLISHGANINEKDNDGEISLHIAIDKDSKEKSELLQLTTYNGSKEIATPLISQTN
ncbi:hypothetical protein TVAG_262000 [Trichomonas vaginalis G3]|uniref:Uncharacterized protein n=1 Tax=Trichomonas vaginalis (strain ATCC PRA-98 / G3) TaxID=412133 RepID=A2DUB2_TRIV3|nr:Ankyrin repeat family [Trichomonas vaginalis G3]EAY15950.1 hypothetical protein TVAG_262000 [Trichomonas vaginalis G3]KAI5523584.1 Ankyrin repeat family [Trichomonas vaginalis G3]|eukprot:XP_001328173.1 hypothetical protein [Trichomonas vaginalis G3]